MLLVIYGAMGIGKTTALKQFMESLETHVDVVTVFADNGYSLRWDGDDLVEEPITNWKGDIDGKVDNARRCMADEERVWVMESGRPDLTPKLPDLYTEIGGGLEVVYVVTTGPTMKTFLQQRCRSKGKTYNDDYWTDSKLWYEGTRRFVGQAINYLIPAGIPYHLFVIDKARLGWLYVLEQLYDIATQDWGWWWPE